MASLYKRATPQQRVMLSIVEGAVRNAAHYHSDRKVDDRFARSIAKRAVGTLSAQWPEVLAAKASARSSSQTGGAEVQGRACPRCGQATNRNERGVPHPLPRRSPLARLHHRIARQLRALKIKGEHDLVAAYIDVLKAISKHESQS
jgi:hypothetical protein